MISISLCMIVKNEERVLERCLKSICDLVDEIVIVDTGSTDQTREIAARFTQRIYDYKWKDDFADARNFAFSKAGCEYIYTADADEVLDEENRRKFKILKETLMPEIEIVQMYYGNQLSCGTVYNYNRELRPKLFRRSRSFVWVDPVHETVRLLPLVFDSEIEITHLPEENHASRDLAIFEKQIRMGRRLSDRLMTMYAKELLLSGSREELLRAEEYFTEAADHKEATPEQMKEALCVVVRAARLRGDDLKMYRYAMKGITDEGIGEVCFELGEYYFGKQEYEEASIWYYNGVYETRSILNVHCSGDTALMRLADCYQALGQEEMAAQYRQAAESWSAE